MRRVGAIMQLGDNEDLGWSSIAVFVGTGNSGKDDVLDISGANELFLHAYITKDREGKPVATVQVAEQVVAPTVQVKAQVTPPVAQVETLVSVKSTSNPASSLQVTPPEAQVAPNEAQVKAQVARHILVLLAHEPLSSSEIVKGLGHKSLSGVVKAHLKNLLMGGFIEMSQPNSPRSPTQKYRLTTKGMAALASYAKE